MYISFYEVALECTREFSPPRAHKKYSRAESAIHTAYALYMLLPSLFSSQCIFQWVSAHKGQLRAERGVLVIIIWHFPFACSCCMRRFYLRSVGKAALCMAADTQAHLKVH